MREGYTPLWAPDESLPGRPSLAHAKTPLLRTALPKTAPVRAAGLKSAPRKTAPAKTTLPGTASLKIAPLTIAPAKRLDRLQTAGPFTAAAGRRRHAGPASVMGHPSAMLPTPSERRSTRRGFWGPIHQFSDGRLGPFPDLRREFKLEHPTINGKCSMVSTSLDSARGRAVKGTDRKSAAIGGPGFKPEAWQLFSAQMV